MCNEHGMRGRVCLCLCRTRLEAAGIPCPSPKLLKLHVLCMSFIGKRGWCVAHHVPSRLPRRSLTCLCLPPCVLLLFWCLTPLRPAPRLKDATLTPTQLSSVYEQVVKTMRTMYQECRLVHADLSEYNILCVQCGGPRCRMRVGCVLSPCDSDLCVSVCCCLLCHPIAASKPKEPRRLVRSSSMYRSLSMWSTHALSTSCAWTARTCPTTFGGVAC